MSDRPSVSPSYLGDLCGNLTADLGIAGAQIAVAVGGRDVVQGSSGAANTALGIAVVDDTVFQIGSTTKLYTALLMMQLVDQGSIDLDTPVTAYLPEVTLALGCDDWRRITPRHLMSMSSGLDNGPYGETGRGDDCVANYVAQLCELPLIFAPGTAYGYSNASSVVSGLIIERVTGCCWDDALKEFVLEPGGFRESVSLYEDLPFFRVATGHFPGQEQAGREWSWGRGMAPTGTTLATSARDLAAFGRIFLDRGQGPSGQRLLSESAIATMQGPVVGVPSQLFASDWCVGPYRKIWGTTKLWGHSGTTQNGGSTLLWVPEHDLSIAVVVNTPPLGYTFAAAVFRSILGDVFGVRPPAPPLPLDAPVDLAPYVGSYASLGWAYEVAEQAGELVIEMVSTQVLDPVSYEPDPPVRTVLRPIAPHRFVPDDDALTRQHAWDVAFGLGGDGVATLLHNGGFTAARI